MYRHLLSRLRIYRFVAAFAALVGVGLVSTSALAEDVATKTKTARMACLTGDHAKGIAILAELFVDTKNTTFVYNQARCYQQNGRYKEAIDRFHEYLRITTNLTFEDKEAVDKHIADCQTLLDKSPSTVEPNGAAVKGPAPLPPLTPMATQVSPLPGATVTDAQPTPTIFESPGERTPGAGLRTTGVFLMGFGGVVLIADIALNLKVNSMARNLEKPGDYSRSTESRRSNYATLTWIGYGVSGAFAVGGIILYQLGRNAARSHTTSVEVSPAVIPDGFGAVVKGTF